MNLFCFTIPEKSLFAYVTEQKGWPNFALKSEESAFVAVPARFHEQWVLGVHSVPGILRNGENQSGLSGLNYLVWVRLFGFDSLNFFFLNTTSQNVFQDAEESLQNKASKGSSRCSLQRESAGPFLLPAVQSKCSQSVIPLAGENNPSHTMLSILFFTD